MDTIKQITLEIQTNDATNITERRFPSNISIEDLKCRLELITGASTSTMKLLFKDTNGQLIGNGCDDKLLGDYLLPGGEQRLRLYVTDPEANKFSDNNNVKKFELSDEEYSKRNDSVRSFMIRNKFGPYGKADSNDGDNVDHIHIGDRCEVRVKNMPTRRGQVMFIGKLADKPGCFIGVRCDEPNGKNDGTFDNVRFVYKTVFFLVKRKL